MHDFNEKIEWANEHEEEVGHALAKVLKTFIVDVRTEQAFQEIDVDFLTAEEEYIEVKCCSQISNTGNLALELFSDLSTQSKGWIDKTCCNTLVYYDVKNRDMHFFDMDRMRKYFHDTRDSHREVCIPNPSWTTLIVLYSIVELVRDAGLSGYLTTINIDTLDRVKPFSTSSIHIGGVCGF
jgi:hypothetical protein